MYYTMDIAGLERNLPLCKVTDELYIAAFIMFGDVEITERCAAKLLEQAPEFDILLTAESKGIPLAYEMARQSGHNEYVIARKGAKLYMNDVVSVTVNSITTDHIQKLYLGSHEAQMMKGKRILIVDDVISTGESLVAMETLVNSVGGNIVGRMSVLAEGDSIDREDVISLEPLPVFNADGTIKK